MGRTSPIPGEGTNKKRIDAQTAYDKAKAKVESYTDRGKDPGGFRNDLEVAANRLREAGGRP
jgi:hypothetical protein